MSKEITEYDPASGVCVVRDHYELDSDGHLEVKKKGAKESDRVAELDRAVFTLVRSFEVDARAQRYLKKVFIEGRISVKADSNTALKDFSAGFVLYKGFHTYNQLVEGRLPNVTVMGKFLHLESDNYYEVGIGNASITQPLKQNEYAFIATEAGIKPASDQH
jgi:hypothetical protein